VLHCGATVAGNAVLTDRTYRGLAVAAVLLAVALFAAPSALAATLTIGGVGNGGCVRVSGDPSHPTSLTFSGTGFRPGATITVRGTSDHGDTYGPFTTTASASGQLTLFVALWVSENQVDTFTATDGTTTVEIAITAMRDADCPATATPAPPPPPTSTPTVSPTPSPTQTAFVFQVDPTYGTNADVQTFLNLLAKCDRESPAFKNLHDTIDRSTGSVVVSLGRGQPGTIVDSYDTKAVDLSQLEKLLNPPRDATGRFVFPTGAREATTLCEVLGHFLSERLWAGTVGGGFDGGHETGIFVENAIRSDFGQSDRRPDSEVNLDALNRTGANTGDLKIGYEGGHETHIPVTLNPNGSFTFGTPTYR